MTAGHVFDPAMCCSTGVCGLAGLNAQEALYAASTDALRDSAQTTLVLVARPDHRSSEW
jgi:hypothetical protein